MVRPGRRLGKRAVAARVLVILCPMVFVGLAGAFGGCSDLVNGVGADGGSSGPVDGGPNTTGDVAAIFLDDSGSGGPSDARGDGPIVCAPEDASFSAPTDLACTGLYSNFATKAVATNVQAYDPALHNWADGAAVSRFIYLPQGAKIDTSNMNEWRFPVGTKAWQEFQVSGHRVETRLYWKRGENDWVRGTYVWNDDATSAVYTTTGATNVGGSSYSIPTIGECDTCHSGRIDRLLGFEAVSLARATATGVTLASLAPILTQPPPAAIVIPDDGTGLAAPALAWLHANCGTSCHSASPGASAASSGLLLRLEIAVDGGTPLGDVFHTNTYRTTVNVAPQLAPYSSEGWHRITPNDSFDGGIGNSLVPFAAQSRNVAGLQMPPIGTSIPDMAGVATLKSWIRNGSFPAGTFPP